MVGKLARQLDRAFFRPETLSPDTVSAIALAAPVAAGLILFRLPAAEMLTLALVIGVAVHLAAVLLRVRLETSPALVSVVGVALCGPLSSLAWPTLVAFTAAVLEVLRCRYWPRARVHAGLVAYGLVYLASSGAVAAYARPGSFQMFPEPIAQWSLYYGGAAHFIEPITLYVGNVAGPVFATSLLAVVLGLAWLWYSRRFSVLSAAAFLLSGVAISLALRWDPVFHLDSGPAWFVVGFILCDRRMLPELPMARPLMAVSAGVIAIGLRAAHMYIEALFITVAMLELIFALTETLARLIARLRVSLRGRLAERGSASA